MKAAAASVLAVMILATGCGQKPGVSELPNGLQALANLPEGATVDPETGNILDAEGNVIGNIGSSGSGTAAGAGLGSTNTDDISSRDDSVDRPDDSTTTTTDDTTGVTPTQIKIGAHAPLTGAAPVPSDSAQKGNQLYWEWLSERGEKIHGRSVEAVLKNDNYNPSQAVAVCKEMVEQDRVFLLYGFAGTDQIQACARYASSASVPYLSVGVTETGLETLPNYFAVSLSYAEQGALLTDFLVTKLGAKRERNGMLRFDTPNFEDAHDSFISSMNKAGARVTYDRSVSRGAGQAEAQAVVQEMKTEQVQNVYVLTSPVWFLQVLQAARTQNYTPQWVGVGISKAIDSVSSVGCRN
ncbi:MAG: ABC transporter substrate-binding protein [Actinomycetota bacterium]|nr:ABC transporter substrate-binding protein [Actinomycetota bacterium]